jgi:surface protein
MNYTKSSKGTSFLVLIAILFATIFTIELSMAFVSPSSVQASNKNIKGSSIQWGDSHWVLADDGELILSNGDIGTPNRPLYEILTNSGIDPNAVQSIEFTENTNASNIGWMFSHLPNLQKIVGISKLNYSGNAEGMFNTDPSLKTIYFTNFDTSKITNMRDMFSYSGFQELDLSGFNTSNVTSMWAMFDASDQLKNLNIDHFDTQKVTNMGFMFYNNPMSILNVSSFDTSNVTNMEGMFDSTNNLTVIDLSNFNTSKVSTMEYMFTGSNISNLDLSSFNTANVTNMHGMFQNAKKLECLDLSSFTITESTNTKDMFTSATLLKQLTLGKKTQLKSDMNISEVPTTDGYKGHWQNVGTGTIENPNGDHIWTSTELMTKFDAATMGDDTFVWQKPANSEISTGTITDYKNDPVLSTYVPTAIDPRRPYRYNVVINNNFKFYSKVDDGQTEAENIADLGDKTGATVYNQKQMPVSYSGGDKDGQKTNFVQVSFNGYQWYWVDQHALNLDLKTNYPSVNSKGIALLDDMFLGSTITYGENGMQVNSQMVGNAYNENGEIIYQSLAKESDFSAEKDPKSALKSFNDNLDRAADNWNSAIGENIFIKSSSTTSKVTLKVNANPAGKGSATLNGNTGIDSQLVEFAVDPNSENYEINLLFITIRHELGHSLGLDHTSNGQYYGMPDEYQFSIDDDVMNAVLVYEPNSGYPWTQKTITTNSINTVKLILANHNFENPQPQTKSFVTNNKIDKMIAKIK